MIPTYGMQVPSAEMIDRCPTTWHQQARMATPYAQESVTEEPFIRYSNTSVFPTVYFDLVSGVISLHYSS